MDYMEQTNYLPVYGFSFSADYIDYLSDIQLKQELLQEEEKGVKQL